MTNPEPPTAAITTPTGRPLRLILMALMLVLFLAALDQTIVSTALPTIAGELGGLDQLSWVVTSYLLASTASTPLWGKISDLVGRKIVLQSAVIIFLVASALAGLSANMGQLIGFRALQGLGGGGLMVLVLATIADVVAPRDRGKYTGLFGAVFAVSMIVGPLLGGFFVDSLSWRWIFYINLPLGLVSLVVLQMVLRLPREHRNVVIDWWGAALMVSGVVLALLVVEWGGRTFAWGSPQILLMSAAAVILLVLFVRQELRTEEPIVPMRLFRERVFSVVAGMGFLLGFGMFGAIVYLPVFLQVVQGHDPTTSGLMLLPLMAGLLTMSIVSGRVVSNTGKYRVFPIVGTAVATIGMALFTQLQVQTPYWQVATFMVILGTGMGMFMQVLVIAVQNAVDQRDLGAATSGTTFFRSMGGSFGTAVLGAVLGATLNSQLQARFPGAAIPDGALGSPEQVAALPPAVRTPVLESLTVAIDRMFVISAVIMLVAFVLSWWLPERPLRHHTDVADDLADSAMTGPETVYEK